MAFLTFIADTFSQPMLHHPVFSPRLVKSTPLLRVVDQVRGFPVKADVHRVRYHCRRLFIASSTLLLPALLPPSRKNGSMPLDYITADPFDISIPPPSPRLRGQRDVSLLFRADGQTIDHQADENRQAHV